MSKKIAPLVRHAVRTATYEHPAAENGKRAEAELRALRSIAAAVGEMKRRAWNRNWEAYAHRAFDAHDRLERVSGLPGRGRAK